MNTHLMFAGRTHLCYSHVHQLCNIYKFIEFIAESLTTADNLLMTCWDDWRVKFKKFFGTFTRGATYE